MYRVLLCCLAMFLTGVAALAGEVKVSGEGVVKVAPDIASFDVKVSSTSAKADDASVMTNLKAQKVIAALIETGLKKDEIRTDEVSLHVQWQKNEPQGYVAEITITVTVCDLKQTGKVMDKAVKAGGTGLTSLRMGLKDEKPHMEKARQLAVKDARRKAEVLAQAAEAKVGKPKLIEDSDRGWGGYRPRILYQTAPGFDTRSTEAPIEPGLVAVSSSVTIIYELATD